jgi:hypothetical protein
MPAPNRAPACDEICGEKDKCTQDASERCSDTMTSAAKQAFQQAADSVAKAINHLTNSPDSPSLAQSLKANFNWSKGNSPPDLPTTVRARLQTALAKFGDNLCIKCRDSCPKGVVAAIVKARGENCLGSNCFNICNDAFGQAGKDVQGHALLHELFHRIAVGAVEDLYRGQPGYPGPPSTALKMPDTFTSLVDDLAGASSAPAPSPSPAPAPTK